MAASTDWQLDLLVSGDIYGLRCHVSQSKQFQGANQAGGWGFRVRRIASHHTGYPGKALITRYLDCTATNTAAAAAAGTAGDDDISAVSRVYCVFSIVWLWQCCSLVFCRLTLAGSVFTCLGCFCFLQFSLFFSQFTFVFFDIMLLNLPVIIFLGPL